MVQIYLISLSRAWIFIYNLLVKHKAIPIRHSNVLCSIWLKMTVKQLGNNSTWCFCVFVRICCLKKTFTYTIDCICTLESWKCIGRLDIWKWKVFIQYYVFLFLEKQFQIELFSLSMLNLQSSVKLPLRVMCLFLQNDTTVRWNCKDKSIVNSLKHWSNWHKE